MPLLPWHYFAIGGEHFWLRASLLVFIDIIIQTVQAFFLNEAYAVSSASSLVLCWLVIVCEMLSFAYALFHRAEPFFWLSTGLCEIAYIAIRFGTRGYISLQGNYQFQNYKNWI